MNYASIVIKIWVLSSIIKCCNSFISNFALKFRIPNPYNRRSFSIIIVNSTCFYNYSLVVLCMFLYTVFWLPKSDCVSKYRAWTRARLPSWSSTKPEKFCRMISALQSIGTIKTPRALWVRDTKYVYRFYDFGLK